MINTRYVIISCVCLNLGTISYAFASNSMNNALNTLLIVFQIKEEDYSFYRGILTSSLYLGALIGAIISSFIERINLGIRLADVCLFSGQFLQIVDNIYIFLLGRLIAGVGSGLQSVCIPLYTRQFSPISMYSIAGGLLSTMYHFTQQRFSLGYLLTMYYGTFFQDVKTIDKDSVDQRFWRIYFFTGGLPSFLRLLYLTFLLPSETPIYYLRNSQFESAHGVIKKIYYDGHDEILEQLQKQSEGFQEQNLKRDLQSNQFKFGLFLMFIFQFSGFNAVVQYSTYLFSRATTEKIAKMLTFIVSILKFLLYTLASLYVTSKFGRRLPILVGILVMFAANLLISVFSLFDSHSSQIAIVSFIFLFIVGNFSSTGPIIPVYLPEIVSNDAVPYCYWTFWGYSIIILQFFPIAQEKLGMSLCFAFFALVTFIAALIFWKYGVETRNKSYREISEMFNKKRESLVYSTSE